MHPPGGLPNPGIKPTSLVSPALGRRFFTTSATWEVQAHMYGCMCAAAAKSLQSCPVFVTPWTTRLLCPWNSPGKNTGVGCHSFLQGIFLTQGSNLHLLCLLHWPADSLPHSHLFQLTLEQIRDERVHPDSVKNASLYGTSTHSSAQNTKFLREALVIGPRVIPATLVLIRFNVCGFMLLLHHSASFSFLFPMVQRLSYYEK